MQIHKIYMYNDGTKKECQLVLVYEFAIVYCKRMTTNANEDYNSQSHIYLEHLLFKRTAFFVLFSWNRWIWKKKRKNHG